MKKRSLAVCQDCPLQMECKSDVDYARLRRHIEEKKHTVKYITVKSNGKVRQIC